MFASSSDNNHPNLKETIKWLVVGLNRPPLPECPIQAATQGKEPKSPHFIEGKYVKSVQWKHWQEVMPPQETRDIWFHDSRMGIGTLGGFNGKHWLCWIDIDQKTFASQDECDRAVEEWEAKYKSILELAPVFRTPNGGYRYLVAFSEKPEGFGANNGFSFTSAGDIHSGELLLDKGHTLLPPTIGLNGKPYKWTRWFEYPPVVSCPGDVGLYAYHKPVKENSPAAVAPAHRSNSNNTSISDFLINEVYPRLTLEQCFNDPCHDFKEYDGGLKLKGNCPWHDSQSGTAFYCRMDNGIPMYACPVDGDGNVIQYRHRLVHGASAPSPRGKEFIDIAKQLALEAGVLDKFPNPHSSVLPFKKTPKASNTKVRNLDGSDIRDCIDKIIDQNVVGTDLDAELFEVADSFNKTPRNIQDFYDKRVKERHQEADIGETKEEILSAIQLDNSSLDLKEILPLELAQALIKAANDMSLKPELYLHQLLATTAVFVGVDTNICLLNKTEFEVSGNLFNAIVSEASQRKSAVRKAISVNPLKKFKQKEKERYEEAFKEYEKDMELWKSLKGEERHIEFPSGEPFAPFRRIYDFTNATGEGIMAAIANQPDHGLLANLDELASFFKSSNAYRGGRGSDEEDILTLYDGGGFGILRADGLRHDFLKSLLSICGGIQPDVLNKFLREGDDPNGKFARFNFVIQSLSALIIESDDDANTSDLTDILYTLYKNIDLNPPTQYKLTREAKAEFLAFYNEMERLRCKEPHKGMRAVFGKAPGKIGKLAINLQSIKYASINSLTPIEVEVDVIRAAIKLQKYYLEQARILYAPFLSNILTPHLQKMFQFASDANGEWVTLGDYRKEKFSAKVRPDSAVLQGYLQELVQMDLVEANKEGKATKFRIILEKSGTFTPKSGTKVDTSSTIETPTGKGTQEKSGQSGTFSHPPSENSQNDDKPSGVSPPPGSPPDGGGEKSGTNINSSTLQNGTKGNNSSTLQNGTNEQSGTKGNNSSIIIGNAEPNGHASPDGYSPEQSIGSNVLVDQNSDNFNKESSTLSTLLPEPGQGNDSNGGTSIHFASTFPEKVPLFSESGENAKGDDQNIKKGDVVQVVDESHNYHGSIGKVSTLYPQAEDGCFVEFESESGVRGTMFKFEKIRKITAMGD